MCCPKTDIIAYVKCFGGGVFPLWFCEDHIEEGKQIAAKWNKDLIIIKKMSFRIGDRTFKKYASAKWEKEVLPAKNQIPDVGNRTFKKYASAKW